VKRWCWLVLDLRLDLLLLLRLLLYWRCVLRQGGGLRLRRGAGLRVCAGLQGGSSFKQVEQKIAVRRVDLCECVRREQDAPVRDGATGGLARTIKHPQQEISVRGVDLRELIGLEPPAQEIWRCLRGAGVTRVDELRKVQIQWV
jgi:hypothetical protein